MGCYCFISLAILALALFLNFYELIPSLPEDDDSYTISTPIPFSKRPYHFVTDQATNLQRTSWNGSATIVDAVLEQYPILFQAPFVSEWEALNWDLWALSRKWPVLFDTLVSKQSLFLFYEDGEGLLGKEEISRPGILPNPLFKTFLTESPNPSIYFYYSTNYAVMESLAQLEQATSWKDFRIWESFVDIFERLNMSADAIQLRQPPPSLSIAHPGVALQMRYHVEHVIRTQIVGRTRYVLFPPTSHSSLLLFPSIHSCHQQSQINLEEEIMNIPSDVVDSQLSEFLQVPHLSVELTQGDSIYIPPYWLVRVENIELSLYLDVKSLSKEQVILSEAQSLGVLLGNISTSNERIVAAQVYAVHFLSRINGLQSPEAFAQSHYSSRYSRIFPRDSLYMTKLLKSFHCLADQQDLYESIILKLDREGIKRSAQYAADRVNALSTGIRWIWVGDYLDLIARWAMKDPKEAVAFLTTCLRFNSKIQVVEEVHGPEVMKIGPNEAEVLQDR